MGLPKLTPKPNLSKIDRKLLFTYLSQHYDPKRMVIAGVGVNHEYLVELSQKYFMNLQPIWETEKGFYIEDKQLSIDDSIAQYTGGFVQVHILHLLDCFALFFFTLCF